MQIPLTKSFIKKELILKQIEQFLKVDELSSDNIITKFEDAVKKYNNDVDGKYIAVSNATNALEVALLYLNNGNTYEQREINEIIIPSWSKITSGFSVPRVGAKAIWCDINRFGVASAKTIEPHISDNTAAIVVVHQLGMPCDMKAINELAGKHNISVIEDGSSAFGSEYENNRIGKSSNITILSFDEGAIIAVRDTDTEKWIRSYIQSGINYTDLQKEFFDKLGGDYIIPKIIAALELAKLQYKDEEINLKTKAAEHYDEQIKSLNIAGFGIACGNIIPPTCTKYNWNDYHIILSKKYLRDVVVEKLRSKGIDCTWDFQATHSQPTINERIVLPGTDIFHKSGLRLPLFAEITKEEQNFIIQSLKEVLDEFTIY